VNHIAVEMKSTVIKNIIEWNNNIALLIDENTTINQLFSLIIYVLTTFPDMNEPTNLFLDIIELQRVTSEGIFKSLMTRLRELGFHDDFLKVFRRPSPFGPSVCLSCLSPGSWSLAGSGETGLWFCVSLRAVGL
jgi:hypothetical protein